MSGAANLVLGVDGGNSKTIALVARLDGTVVGAGRAGVGDIYGAESAEAGLEAIEEAVRAALDSAGARTEYLAAGAFSLAGADWPEDIALLERAMHARRFGHRVLVVNDAIGALRAGSSEGTGVAVVCGTGLAVGARAPSGITWHGGFWLEDIGARTLGRAALRAVYRSDLGIERTTTLTGRVLDLYQQDRVEDVLHLLTARERAPVPDVAHVARLLLDEAAAGDAVADRIVREQGRQIGDYALAAARRVGLEHQPFTLVLTGGLLRHPSGRLPDAIVERVRERSPHATPIRGLLEPVAGALIMALEAAGARLDHALHDRLRSSLPPAMLFATELQR